MNCNIEILQTIPLESRGEYVCKISKGDVYAGTANKSRVIFHVTDAAGKIQKATMSLDDNRIKVTMYQTSV